MECCTTHHAVFVKRKSCNLEDDSPRQVKFIISDVHTIFLRPDEGDVIFFETWSHESVHNSFPLDSSAFKNITCTRETLSQLGLESCCVDQSAQVIYGFCNNAMHSMTIRIDVSTVEILCERCYNERIMAESVLNDDDHVMIPASKSAINELMMNEETCNGDSDEDCTVCLEKFHDEERVVRMPCTHVFHSCCIEKWLQHSHYCPLCRFELATEVE